MCREYEYRLPTFLRLNFKVLERILQHPLSGILLHLELQAHVGPSYPWLHCFNRSLSLF
jgi:hypothetical protein